MGNHPELIGVMAMGPNREIGLNGKIPWYYSDELKWFSTLTKNKTILMGSTTWEKFPKQIKKRKILVLSKKTTDLSYYNPQNDLSVASINNPLDILEYSHHDEIYICGGAKIYTLYMKYISKFYVSYIKHNVGNADTYIPEFESLFPIQLPVNETENFKTLLLIKNTILY